jgi:aminopeptidase
MENSERLAGMARLAVRTGVAVREGQELLVHADLEHAELVRAIVDEAYAAGARYVDVLYSDRHVRRGLVAGAPDEVIGWAPPWLPERLQRAVDEGGAAIGISSGSGADIFRGLDPQRLARSRPREVDRIWMQAINERTIAWSLIALPTASWAAEIFGEPDVERLWDAFAHALRLDHDDPAAAWDARLGELEARAAELTARDFSALRYRGPGTELEIGLIPGSRWIAGREHTIHGQVHAANLPTEEVFTTPDCRTAEGVIRASKPLVLHGTVIEDLEVRFAGGEVVGVEASSGADVVRADMGIDDGGRRRGEVALVDVSSRVGETGVVFHNTLLDENAASHIAWGSGLAWTLPDGAAEHPGLNDSVTHVDFMVGSEELEVDGVEAGGAVVPLLREARWQI